MVVGQFRIKRLIGSWLLRRYFTVRNGGVRSAAAEFPGSFPRLAHLRELLRDVETSVPRSSNPDSDVRVVRVQDIPPMILLEFRLIHEQGFGLAHACAIGDVFPS